MTQERFYEAGAGVTVSEMQSLLATLTDTPAERIGGWVVIVRQNCGKAHCIGLGCEDGPVAFLSTAASVELGKNEPYVLHMMAEAIEDIAAAMRDRAL